ncbi:MAG: prepilin-type N-terminal cleavage/methylation domain-containing protein [bacterium]|nr:prepilin-type N-terminal cleavage/methylation domain-containing protein [bacterium]
MMTSINNSQKGFSLLELMVAMAVASVLMAGIYTFYQNQIRGSVTQQALVDMQQDARVGMYMMTREIRMAGCDPQNSTGAALRIANAAEIAFDSDEDGDGAIDAASERFYYALSSDANGDGVADGTPCNLERGAWDDALNPSALNAVALNIDALNFVYLDSAGNVLDDDGNGNVVANINAVRSVEITLLARSGDELPVMMRRQTDTRTYANQQGTELLGAQNDNFRRLLLTASVKVRNLGL